MASEWNIGSHLFLTGNTWDSIILNVYTQLSGNYLSCSWCLESTSLFVNNVKRLFQWEFSGMMNSVCRAEFNYAFSAFHLLFSAFNTSVNNQTGCVVYLMFILIAHQMNPFPPGPPSFPKEVIILMGIRAGGGGASWSLPLLTITPRPLPLMKSLLSVIISFFKHL